jgi:hypothetical protein
MKKLRCSSLPAFMTCASSDLEPTTGKEVEESHELARVGDAVHAALAIGIVNIVEDEYCDGEWIPTICEINRVEEKDIWPLYKRGLKAFRTICAELLGEEPKEVGTELASSEEIGGEILLTGTVDLVTQPIGLDWKSGYRIYEPKWQLNGYKRLHCFEYGVIVWLRDDVIDVYRDLLEAPDFDDALMEQLRKIGQEEVFGEHCFGCKRQHECETYRWQMRNTTMAMDIVRDGSSDLDAHALAKMKPRVALLEQAIEKYKRLLKWSIASAGPQPVGDGKELAIIEKSRTEIDPAKGSKIIQKYIGKPKFLKVLSLTKGALEEAVKDSAEQGQKAKKWRQCMQDLEAEGAVSKNPYSEMRVRRIVK